MLSTVAHLCESVFEGHHFGKCLISLLIDNQNKQNSMDLIETPELGRLSQM